MEEEKDVREEGRGEADQRMLKFQNLQKERPVQQIFQSNIKKKKKYLQNKTE